MQFGLLEQVRMLGEVKWECLITFQTRFPLLGRLKLCIICKHCIVSNVKARWLLNVLIFKTSSPSTFFSEWIISCFEKEFDDTVYIV